MIRQLALCLVLFALPAPMLAQTSDPERIRALETQLAAAQSALAELQSTIDELAVELGAVRDGDASPPFALAGPFP